jgi:trans-aconitate methyltransferase
VTGEENRSSINATLRGGVEERIALMAPSRRLRLELADSALATFACGRPIRMLDAGTGDGLLALAIAKRHPSWEVVGMDLREDLLANARRRAAHRRLDNAGFVQADLTRPLPESEFDAVMAIECLSEIPDDRAALRAMAGALTPGGLFVAQAPAEGWRPVFKSSEATWREEVRHGYSAAALAQALRDAGLEQVEVEPTYRATATAAQEVRDRIKNAPLPLRAAAFPAMVGAVHLERWGVTGGPSRALFATANRGQGSAH